MRVAELESKVRQLEASTPRTAPDAVLSELSAAETRRLRALERENQHLQAVSLDEKACSASYI